MFSKICETLFGRARKAANSFTPLNLKNDVKKLETPSNPDGFSSLETHDEDSHRTLAFLRTVLASEPVPSSQVDGSLLLAQTRIRRLPGGLTIKGHLDLRRCQRFQGFGDGSLRVDGSLAIGGMTPKTEMTTLPSALRNKYGRRVSEFLRTPSREKRCPLAALPEETQVGGNLVLRNCIALKKLPDYMAVGGSIVIQNCPQLQELRTPRIVAGDLVVTGSAFERLPAKLRVDGNMQLQGLPIKSLPEDLVVGGSLLITQCPELDALPPNLVVGQDLKIRESGVRRIPDCTKVRGTLALRNVPVEKLSSNLDVGSSFIVQQCNELAAIQGKDWTVYGDLSLGQCTKLTTLPDAIAVGGRMSITRAHSLAKMPLAIRVDGFSTTSGQRFRHFGTRLVLTDCARVQKLPHDLILPQKGSIDIAGTPVASVSAKQMRQLLFQWRGVPISARALFEPERLTAEEVLTQPNAEVRRVMMERLGPANLLKKGQGPRIGHRPRSRWEACASRVQARRSRRQ